MIRILYFGPSQLSATGKHRADALIRIGCRVWLHDPFVGIANCLRSSWYGRFHYQTGYRFLQKAVRDWLEEVLSHTSEFDLIWVDGGELFGKVAVELLRKYGVPIVLFNHDDPTGRRDRRRFHSLVTALPLYDVATAVRAESEEEMRAIGVATVLRIWRTYDEVQHRDVGLESAIYESDVCFIGTWIRNEARDDFLLSLIERGVMISIWGDRWQRSPRWRQLSPFYRGGALKGSEYVAAIRGAKVCLGLLSKGNRDLHTTRSMEIPYAGGLLCAERTSEHRCLYVEDEEAVFWSSAEECAEKCIDLLNDSDKRQRIRLAGMARVRRNKVGNEDACRKILRSLEAIDIRLKL